MSRKPFRWTKRRLNLRTMIEADGVDAVNKRIEATVRKAAKEQGWRISETAMALSDWHIDIDEVAKHLPESKP